MTTKQVAWDPLAVLDESGIFVFSAVAVFIRMSHVRFSINLLRWTCLSKKDLDR